MNSTKGICTHDDGGESVHFLINKSAIQSFSTEVMFQIHRAIMYLLYDHLLLLPFIGYTPNASTAITNATFEEFLFYFYSL